MAVHNREIAEAFARLADLLEIEGADRFRVGAYREAARVVSGLSQSLADMVDQGEDLSRLPGVGKAIAKKIETQVRTGTLPLLEEVQARTPAALSDMMKIAGLGPKRVKILHEALGVNSLEDLRRVVEQGAVHGLPGFGVKSEAAIRSHLAQWRGQERRFRLLEAEEIIAPLVAHLRQVKGVKQLDIAGSYRRRKETVGDIDILATCTRGSPIMEALVAYPEVEEIASHGTTRSTVHLRCGMQVDLRVVPQVSYGAALQYFTGSKAHNVALRTIAVRNGLKINEYGVFRGARRVAGRTEEEVYRQVGLCYIEPELREDRGEIDAARQGQLPRLVTLDDIRGDLHVHTNATDGRDTLEAMAQAAAARGYQYLAITDHSQRVGVANGLDTKRLAAQIREIDKLNEKLDGLTLLKSIEVDILEDGSLDLPDAILKDLDLRVCSIHYRFNLARRQQTERVIRAMDNPYFNIFAHPSGRLLNQREPYDVDIERIMEAALERGCFLEVNSQPSRLDLTDADCKMARDMGLKIAISTDAHGVSHLDYMRFGVGQARRGWLGADDVLNTRRLSELRQLLRRA